MWFHRRLPLTTMVALTLAGAVLNGASVKVAQAADPMPDLQPRAEFGPFPGLRAPQGGDFLRGFVPRHDAPPRTQVGVPPKPALSPAARAAEITKALAPRPSVETVRRQTLDTLYAKLAVARDADESKGLASLIGDVWMRSQSDTANLIMQRAVVAISARDYTLATDLLDRLVILEPGWPEAWNKRASARFFAGDLDGAMEDVDHVLTLEPRHFGALEGMAAILQRTGFDRRALEVYRRALAIYPHQPAVEKIVEKLQLDVEGQGI